jgi:sugar phosphate isomerase/epimerase
MAKVEVTRRELIVGVAALPAVLKAAADTERYKLGVMAGMYSTTPLDDAMTRIRKIGYRYVSMSAKHADQVVYAPEMSKAERTQMLQRIKDLGITPFMSLGGFRGLLEKEDGLAKYTAQLDLCADFGIGVMVGAGPWYYQKFPNLPKRELDFEAEVTRFYQGMEKALRHAESVRVVAALKPHTGMTARGRECMEVLKRLKSPWFKIAWDAGNISYYEGIYPDPDFPDVAGQVGAVCLKDHKGLRGVEDFPIPGQGNVDHEAMFRTLFKAGFNGPLAIERLDGKDGFGSKAPAAAVDQRLTDAYRYLAPLLDRVTSEKVG